MHDHVIAKPDGVGQEWWDAILRVASTSSTREVFDKRTRGTIHDLYDGYQRIEGNGLPRDRKDFFRELRRLARRAWHAVQAGDKDDNE